MTTRRQRPSGWEGAKWFLPVLSMVLTFESLSTGVFTFVRPLDLLGCRVLLGARLSFLFDLFPCVINFTSHPTYTSFLKPHLTLASDTVDAGTTTHRAHIPAAPEPTPRRQASAVSVVECQHLVRLTILAIPPRVEFSPRKAGDKRTFLLPCSRGMDSPACPAPRAYVHNQGGRVRVPPGAPEGSGSNT
jgi:hypothetical protein